MSKITAIANQKGGVGKTTTAINLSAALGEAGQRVLLVDFDPQANTTSGLTGTTQKNFSTIYDILCGRAEAKNSVIKDAAAGVDLLASDINLSGAEIELTESPEGRFALKDALKDVKSDYDYILIDCPPSLGALTVNALAASDSVIIPVQCEYFALEGLSQILKSIDIVSGGFNKTLKIEGILFTMYDARTRLSEQVVESVKNSLDEYIFSTVIPKNVRLAEAPSYSMPITEYDSGSRGAESYRLLAAELIEKTAKGI